MNSDQPIGIFDSGLGGLSVAREIRRLLPGENIVYIADSAYCPYGGRSLDEITERATAVSEMLLQRGAKLIVVACNTASGAAIDLLRTMYAAPIVGLEPAVKPAAASSLVGRVAVLATPATLKTQRFNRLVDRHANGVELVKVPCPGFVELVESGRISGPETMRVVRRVLKPVLEADVDRVVLGCTHYPFLRGVIADVVGPGVEILDSGAAVARQVERVLMNHRLLASRSRGWFNLHTTGDPATVQAVAGRLWKEEIAVHSSAA